MQNADAKHPAIMISVLAILLAGFIHIAITPMHFEHTPAHGIFFLLAGVFEVIWAYSFWMDSSRQNVLIGLGIAGSLLALWAITQAAGAPFSDGPEPIDSGAIACKVSELAGLVGLIFLAVQGRAIGGEPRKLPRVLAEALGLALVISLITYGLGRAAEPLMPDLATGQPQDTGLPPATIGDLTISGAWIRPPVLSDGTAAVYMVITNRGNQPDSLRSICAKIAADCELNQTVTVGFNTQMNFVDSVAIPAHGKAVLETGGYHSMLKTLDYIPQAGAVVTLTVTFEHSGTVKVDALVRDLGYDDSHSH